MVRGTFANIRLRNAMAPGTEGGLTRHMPSGDQTTIHDAAERYRRDAVPLIVIAGANYGCGSSRDWAAKGTQLLGIRAVIAESFERIHRSNLIGIGIIPLPSFPPTQAAALTLDGSETFDLQGLSNGLIPRLTVTMQVHPPTDGTTTTIPLTCRVPTPRRRATGCATAVSYPTRCGPWWPKLRPPSGPIPTEASLQVG